MNLSPKVLATIHALDGRTIARYKRLIELLGARDVASIESFARHPEATYTEFSEWLNEIQVNCEMIASNCKRIQEEL